jgi:UDP-N-acetylmuramate dehydrogenase
MRIETEFNLTDFNAYRVNAICNRAFFPDNAEDVKAIFEDCAERPIIIGNGNNLLLSKAYYEKDFVIFHGNFNKIDILGNTIIAEAGATLEEVSDIAFTESLEGMEVFWDIPSSIGGAVVMNAGASGEELKDVLLKVEYLDLDDLVIKQKTNNEINFSYRNSFFQENSNAIVLKACFALNPGIKKLIGEKRDTIRAKRWEKQPRNYPNCGSVFKRPEGRFVGPMLDELALKGFRVGGAQVSEKHSGFIINAGNATGADILMLIHEIQDKVKTKFGIELEVEQRII